MILNQLGRRNVSPEAASVLRGRLNESMKLDTPNPGGANQHNEVKGRTCPQPTTAQQVAAQTGVSERTVKTDARLVRALEELGISEADYMAGKVLDANGKKRGKTSIIKEAFPPKAEEAQESDEDTDPVVVDGTKKKKPAKEPKLAKFVSDDAERLWVLAKTDLDKILKIDISRERVLHKVIAYANSRLNNNKRAPSKPWETAREVIRLIGTLNDCNQSPMMDILNCLAKRMNLKVDAKSIVGTK